MKPQTAYTPPIGHKNKTQLQFLKNFLGLSDKDMDTIQGIEIICNVFSETLVIIYWMPIERFVKRNPIVYFLRENWNGSFRLVQAPHLTVNSQGQIVEKKVNLPDKGS